MESEVKRIYNYNDNPKIGNPTPIINIQQNIQQQVVPINIQQPYLQQNQPLYNQTVIIQSGQQNIIVCNQAVPVINKQITFTNRRANIICPYCGNLIKTDVELSFSFFKCFIFFLCIILIIMGGCQGTCNGDCCKDGCCCCCCCSNKKKEEPKPEPEPEPADECCTCFDDATHSCPVCKQIVGVSQTC